jgi:geranylgeranyl diphosphate synthase type I
MGLSLSGPGHRIEPVSPQTVSVDPQRLHTVIAEELALRRAELIDIDPELGELADLLISFVNDGGKRLRPEFLWCGWISVSSVGSGSAPPRALLIVGAALELIQACALIHDDVIDRSESRRGRPATHTALAKVHADAGLSGDSEHYGVSAAVLLGDLALAWADDLYLAGAQQLGAVERSMPVWRAMRTEVLAGQLLDLAATAATDPDPTHQAAKAMRVNRFKTAAYTVERPLQLGAALAGAGPDTIGALRRYGADIGVAFQLRDDLLGVYGDPAVTGKPAGGDLVEGKRTLLLATARDALAADPTLLAELDSGVGVAGANTGRLAEVIAGTGAPSMMEQRITELHDSGLAALLVLDSGGRAVVSAAARDRLHELARQATARTR